MTKQVANPRFTVIIPTKDRAPYLEHTLRTCTHQDYDNLEVVVSDDGSSDATRQVVEETARRDPRVRYTRPAKGAGMMVNFEHALDQVRPGYVIALGGDDGLLPHGIQGMRDALRALGQELLTWPAPVYFYEGTRSPTAQVILHVKGMRLQDGHRVISSRTFLQRQARELSYIADQEVPMFYVKGVVNTDLVHAVRRRTPGGRFYACTTPDGYSGIVLAGEVETFGFTGRPLSIHGVSPTSAGISYLGRTDQAKKVSDDFFKNVAQQPMHSELASQPYSPLITLMTADYLLTARDLPGWPGVRPVIDMRNLLARSLAELRDGLFSTDRLSRELSIVHAIAEHHGLADHFRAMVRGSRRNVKETLEGNALSPNRAYFNGTDLEVKNVFDASYFAYHAHRTSAMLTPSVAWRALRNSVQYRLAAMRHGAPFPPESEWAMAKRGS